MRILTCKEVREAEQEAINRPSMSTLVLMQRAGYAVAQFCLSNFKFSSVCAVCGKEGALTPRPVCSPGDFHL